MDTIPPARRERRGDLIAGFVVCALLAIGPLRRLPETGWSGRRDRPVPLPVRPLRIDPNVCPAGLLAALPGVGPVLAGRIDAERRRVPFATASDLDRVRGIGPATIASVRPYLQFGLSRGR